MSLYAPSHPSLRKVTQERKEYNRLKPTQRELKGKGKMDSKLNESPFIATAFQF